MRPTRVPHLPDVLIRYPIGSLVIYRRSLGYDMHAHAHRYQNVLARVTGKTPRQGNKRLAFDALFIGSNITGVNVLYVKHFHAVDVSNIMPLATWYATRGANI